MESSSSCCGSGSHRDIRPRQTASCLVVPGVRDQLQYWEYQAASPYGGLQRNQAASLSSPLDALLVCKQVTQSLNFCPLAKEK